MAGFNPDVFSRTICSRFRGLAGSDPALVQRRRVPSGDGRLAFVFRATWANGRGPGNLHGLLVAGSTIGAGSGRIAEGLGNRCAVYSAAKGEANASVDDDGGAAASDWRDDARTGG